MELNQERLNALTEKYVGKKVKFVTEYEINLNFSTTKAHWAGEGTVQEVEPNGRLSGDWGYLKILPEEVEEIL